MGAGFISYDYVRRYENLPIIPEDDLGTPDLFFYLFDEWAVLDVEKETVYFITLPGSGIDPVRRGIEVDGGRLVGLKNKLSFKVKRLIL